MTSDLIVRRARREDEDALVRLAGRLTAFALPEWRTPDEIITADARAMIDAVRGGDSSNEVFVAERDRAAVGCLHMVEDTDFFGKRHAHISVIATSEVAEGTGVGRALMAAAEAWGRSRGLTLLTLNVFDANARARRFYEQAGLVPEVIKYAKAL
jgi:GNAT superfamily N-acetyltransferase